MATLPDQSPATAPEAIITQEELAEFRDLLPLSYRCDRLRRTLIEKCESNASIEPGPLKAKLEVSYEKRFSQQKLTQLLGLPGFLELRRDLERTPVRHLIVTDCSAAAGEHGNGRNANRDETS